VNVCINSKSRSITGGKRAHRLVSTRYQVCKPCLIDSDNWFRVQRLHFYISYRFILYRHLTWLPGESKYRFESDGRGM
jgi:hypothetical protein